jgi:hypothetical protein
MSRGSVKRKEPNSRSIESIAIDHVCLISRKAKPGGPGRVSPSAFLGSPDSTSCHPGWPCLVLRRDCRRGRGGRAASLAVSQASLPSLPDPSTQRQKSKNRDNPKQARTLRISPARSEVLRSRLSKLEKDGKGSPEPSSVFPPCIGGQARLRCRSGVMFTLGWEQNLAGCLLVMIVRLGPMPPRVGGVRRTAGLGSPYVQCR